jgi:RNA polymerase sigma-70 factor (ECF subfamily)
MRSPAPRPVGETKNEVQAGLSAHLRRLWRYGMVLSANSDMAEDLVQATCVRALERASQYEPGTRLDRWLFSILHSIWLNDVRSRRIRMGQGFVDAETVLVTDGLAAAENQVMANEVLRRVKALPEAQRATVFLAYVEGMSYREVAEILEIPIGTVMSRLATARAKLAPKDDAR